MYESPASEVRPSKKYISGIVLPETAQNSKSVVAALIAAAPGYLQDAIRFFFAAAGDGKKSSGSDETWWTWQPELSRSPMRRQAAGRWP